jgi:hypothetical protein
VWLNDQSDARARADDFDAGHRGVPSQGISLEAVLAAVPRVRQHDVWIDF